MSVDSVVPSPAVDAATTSTATIALVGNPNVGKTSVFNRLTNLFARTSNFPGTTIERRVGEVRLADGTRLTIVDLPGLYSLEAASPEETVARSFLEGRQSPPPDGILVILDATNLQRSLFVAGQALELDLPTVVAVNMIELSERQGLHIDCQKLATELGCPVIPVSARTGSGFDELRKALASLTASESRSLNVLTEPASCDSCSTCAYAHGHRWATQLARDSTHRGLVASSRVTDAADRVLTHAVFGPAVFAATMLLVFLAVFWLAQFPMELLDATFGWLSSSLAEILPAGDFSSLITDGIVAGVGGVLVFLPQICILFFALAVLEDSGYLARAVVVVDRWMRKVGLPGQAFVPLLAAHACAIPAIMATKVIENRRDRLAAIMVIPLMTCSARLPVYTIIAAMLFPRNAAAAALLFAAAYALGMCTAFVMAFVLKLTILPGQASPLILDLPAYRTPSLMNALRQAYERGWVFIRDAGTVILVISVTIWALSTYPKLSESDLQATIQASNTQDVAGATEENLRLRAQQEHSVIGRMGRVIEPVFRPLGFDWKTSVGVLSSFAAREVVVSTLSVLYGLGAEPEEEASLTSRLTSAKRPDGTRVFDAATCISLLVFFVLAMQCLPTQAVTKKETGSWKWAAFQFGYMSVLAYAAAFVARQVVLFAGV